MCRLKYKALTMEAPRSFLVIICAVFVYSAGLTNSAPAELSSLSSNNSNTSGEIGAYPTATLAPTMMVSTRPRPRPRPRPTPADDAKPWPPQKPFRSKHITKSNLHKKPTKDKGGWAKQQAGVGEKSFYSPTLVSTGYDVEEDNFSRHKEASSTATGNVNGSTPIDTVVDNVNGLKDYNNKNSNNSSTLQHSITHSNTTKSVSTNVQDDDGDDDVGKDIDFISVAVTTKADETYATASTTKGYYAKEEVAALGVVSTAATMQTGLVENPNFNAEPIAKMSTKSRFADDIQNIKSIFLPAETPTLSHGKSLPMNASVSSSLALPFSQDSVTPTTTVLQKLDVGHDGVKVTKKKQLFDKHFIAAAGPSGSLHPPITKNNPWPLSKNKPSKSGKKLIEIPNGYLGPIIMKEKTFSVSHHSKKPKPSIVEQLRDKKLVEIIAPTALMEPTMKVKSSVLLPPEFVATDGTSAAVISTTNAPSEGTSTPTEPTPVTTVATTKEQIESETATTYFLVVTQDSKTHSTKSSGSEIMEAMNSGEIETTLREIYTDVLNAMEGVSKKETTPAETDHTVVDLNVDTDAETSSSATDMDVDSTGSTIRLESNAQSMVTDRMQFSGDNHLPSETYNQVHSVVEQPLSTENDPISVTMVHPISDHIKSSAVAELRISKHDNIQPSISDRVDTDYKDLHSTHQVDETSLSPLYNSSTQVPSLNAVTDKTPMTNTSTIISDTNSSTETVFSTQDYNGITTEISFTSTQMKDYSDHSIGTDRSLLPITDDFLIITDHSSTSSPMVHHDYLAGTSSNPFLITDSRSSTFFPITTTLSESNPTSASSSTIRHLKPTHDSEQTESKISDIQIEVYDSTVEPILASTNFKDNTNVRSLPSHATPKQVPSNKLPQERFTQYVVDKATDFATQDSNAVAKASGKPEPAAIEIHINVSEGFGNESEDLEFSYRQSDYRKMTPKKPANTNFITLKPFDAIPQNETSNEAAEEIVVEIIDGNSNITENSGSRENLNVNPIFTFRSDDDSQVELKNVKYYPEDRLKEGTKSTDDFFVPHVGQQPPGVNKPMTDRDSDTIFYISNTEVKVGESIPTTNTYDAQMKKSRLESQFFPANYEAQKKVAPQRYEEDIILSPLKNRVLDPLKLVRGPLDISYIGESVMDVEQVTITTTIPPPIFESTPNVIIQPAILPEMVIGVPVIGELPPQIELKEIDFMPNFDGNKEESSIQYGGDLIDEGGAMGAGFDMDSYPLGNMGLGQKIDSISSQIVLNHHVNHLKKDELTADLGASSETADGNELLRRSNDSVNGTVIGEKMGNATAYSVMEEPPAGDGELHFTDLHMLFMACFATLLPLVLSVFMAFGLRHLYRKYQTNPFNVMGHNSSTDPLDAEKGTSGEVDANGVETPEELRASSLAFGATTDSASLEICTNSNEVNGKASDGDVDDDGRDCNGSAANGRASSEMDVDCIQAIIADDVHEENAIFIVNCNNAAPPIAPTATPPQSTNTTSAAATPTIGTMQCNYSGANGSITTMTLKNNHLIVETEERNDISRDARETKMHYNNSEKDGVFVVEVSRGADSKIMPGSPVADGAEKRPFNVDAAVKIISNQEDKLRSNHEEVQVHPPPPENMNHHDEIESNHLHQIVEVDEVDECSKIAKHSNTGLSQSDLSSSSSVDSNKRYSYGNQELYTIEQQDYTTPSPAATKAPHPRSESQLPQPENHNDDNGHSENGHCLENGHTTAPPNCGGIQPSDTDSDVNGHSGVESKPKITAALLKQDTVIVNGFANGVSHNGNGDDEATPHSSMENLSNGQNPITKTYNTVIDYGGDAENGFDSIISLPEPPSTEEMKQMNDIILMETNQLDSLPPPPPPSADNHHQHNGNGDAAVELENGDSHSIVSSASPMNTPTKVIMASAPPTITVAVMVTSSVPTDIAQTNGNCMTGHTTTASTAAVVAVSGSS